MRDTCLAKRITDSLMREIALDIIDSQCDLRVVSSARFTQGTLLDRDNKPEKQERYKIQRPRDKADRIPRRVPRVERVQSRVAFR